MMLNNAIIVPLDSEGTDAQFLKSLLSVATSYEGWSSSRGVRVRAVDGQLASGESFSGVLIENVPDSGTEDYGGKNDE